MRLSVHTVRLSFTTLAGICAFWVFPDSGPNYIHFQNYKNGGTQQGCTVKGMHIHYVVYDCKETTCKTSRKRRAIWVREWIHKNRSRLRCLPRITKKSLKILQDSESFRIFLRMNKAWKHVDKSRTHPGKHDASSQRCFNVGPSS